MVGVKFIGRLGNQLFQVAFLHYLKTSNPDKTFFFVNPHHSYINKYFELGKFYDLALGSKFYSIFTRSLYVFMKSNEEYIQSIHVPRKVNVKNWVVYKGFYQTDWYYNHTPSPLNLKIKPKFINNFENKFGELFSENKIVAIHIRRTDYLKYGKRDISLPMEYFKTRLEAIEDLDSYKVIFVSDDIQYVKSYFENKANYIFSINDEITDFQIIMNADIAIIANSSFAWWAAFLSKKNSIVYAPKNWLGFRIGKEHPKRIMTDRFIWCDVNSV